MKVRTSKLVFELGFRSPVNPTLFSSTGARVFDEKTYYVARLLIQAKMWGQLSRSRFLWLPVVDGERLLHGAISVMVRVGNSIQYGEDSFANLQRRWFASGNESDGIKLILSEWELVPLNSTLKHS